MRAARQKIVQGLLLHRGAWLGPQQKGGASCVPWRQQPVADNAVNPETMT